MIKRYRVLYRSTCGDKKCDFGSADFRYLIVAKMACFFWPLSLVKGHSKYSKIEPILRKF